MATIAKGATASPPTEGAAAIPSPSASIAPQVEESAFVRQGEFRLFKWIAAFTLASVVGGFGLLYQKMANLEVALERLRTDILREMHREHEKIRTEMHLEHGKIRAEMHLEHGNIRADMHREHEKIRTEMNSEHKQMNSEHKEIRDAMNHQHTEQQNKITAVLERITRLETSGRGRDDAQ